KTQGSTRTQPTSCGGKWWRRGVNRFCSISAAQSKRSRHERSRKLILLLRFRRSSAVSEHRLTSTPEDMKALLKSMQTEWTQLQRSADSRVPLYHQLYSLLKDAILEGRFTYNEQMPTEQQLITAFNVSRITAKRAMDEL